MRCLDFATIHSIKNHQALPGTKVPTSQRPIQRARKVTERASQLATLRLDWFGFGFEALVQLVNPNQLESRGLQLTWRIGAKKSHPSLGGRAVPHWQPHEDVHDQVLRSCPNLPRAVFVFFVYPSSKPTTGRQGGVLLANPGHVCQKQHFVCAAAINIRIIKESAS